MKPKPKPKVKLAVVERSDLLENGVINFYPHSAEAAEFVEKEAPRYGSLASSNKQPFLVVSPLYSFQEVVEYFKSYNDKEVV